LIAIDAVGSISNPVSVRIAFSVIAPVVAKVTCVGVAVASVVCFFWRVPDVGGIRGMYIAGIICEIVKIDSIVRRIVQIES
jgi:hypothetical protein